MRNENGGQRKKYKDRDAFKVLYFLLLDILLYERKFELAPINSDKEVGPQL